MNTAAEQQRSVEEPMTQSVVRGPRDGFTESIGTNISLIRKRIKSPNLWLESMTIGRVTQTTVSIMYINGIVNDKIVDEVRQRLSRIDIDGILESGNIEELIQDETFTPFPTVYNTERPDVIASGLLEGRVAILVDGTPLCSKLRSFSRNFSIFRGLLSTGGIRNTDPHAAIYVFYLFDGAFVLYRNDHVSPRTRAQLTII